MLLCFSVQFINSVLFLMDNCTSCAEQQQPIWYTRGLCLHRPKNNIKWAVESQAAMTLDIVFLWSNSAGLSLSFFLTLKADLCLNFYLCVIKYVSLWLTEHKTSTYFLSVPLSLSPHTPTSPICQMLKFLGEGEREYLQYLWPFTVVRISLSVHGN